MGEWRYASYKCKGLSHRKDGTNCQDNICVVDADEYLVAALSDGLGSLKHSEIASEIATRTVCDAFANLECTIKELPGFLLQKIVSAIQAGADLRGIQLSEMDCTLVFVCIYKNESKVIIGRLGDSAICIFTDDKAIALNDGNKTANGTNAVLDRDAIDNFFINAFDYKKEGINGFILSSDGLENILYMKGSNAVNKAAEEYFNTLVTSDSPENEIRGKISKLVHAPDSPFDDDISIIVIGCNDEPITLPEDATWLCTCGCRNPLYATYCMNCNSDFAVLYEKVRFKEHGGKSAFFKKINKNPEEEKRLLGIKMDSGFVHHNATRMDISTNTNGVSDGLPESETRTRGRISMSSHLDEARNADAIREPQRASDGIANTTLESNNVNADEYRRREEKKRVPSMSESDECSNDRLCEEKIEGESHRKKKKNKNVVYRIFALASALFSLLIGVMISSALWSRLMREKTKEIDLLKATIKALEEEKRNEVLYESPDAALASMDERMCIVLDSGAYYWGDLDEFNSPIGIGILKDNNVYYVGWFDHGIKNGDFIIVDSSDSCKNVIYEDDKIIESQKEEKYTQNEDVTTEEISYSLCFNANLRSQAGTDSRLITMLDADTEVYIVSEEEVVIDDEAWICVKTCDGAYEGWILKKFVTVQNPMSFSL